MIKIDTSKVDKWEDIKKLHSKYCEDEINYDETKFPTYNHETKEFLQKIKPYKKAIAISPFNITLKELGISEKEISWLEKINEIYNESYFKIPKKKRKVFKENLKKVFNYKRFSESEAKEKWNRHKLLSYMGIRTCCYCNREYITYYSVKDSYMNRPHITCKTTADLDHFYPQDQYPFLALSLYNFIPSCQICNSRFKLAKINDIVYPYNEEFGDEVFFEVTSEDGDLNYIYKQNAVTIKINTNNSTIKSKVDESIKIFKLDELYQSHEDYAIEIIKKIKMYGSDEGINDIYKKYGQFFENKDEFKRIIFGNYYMDEDLNKRPLSKLTRDILLKHGFECR